MKSKIKLFYATILVQSLFAFHFASAALVKCGTEYPPTPDCKIGDLIDGVIIILNYLMGTATLVAIGFILFGGVRMVVAAGNEGQIKTAKTTIINAIAGLVVIILGYLIVTSVTAYLTGVPFNDLRTKFLRF